MAKIERVESYPKKSSKKERVIGVRGRLLPLTQVYAASPTNFSSVENRQCDLKAA